MASVITRDDFGDVLRTWRARRNQSQLTLASEAGVSQRHISFLETGRSRPSREMVIHLGVVLDVSLREQNAMLVAAGFAPVYPERSIDHPDLADIRQALDLMLDAHNPFPAYVIDRTWNLLLANDAAGIVLAALPDKSQALVGNLLKLSLHPDGLRTVVSNWHEAAAAMLWRLEREIDEAPGDTALMALLEEVREYPGLPSQGELARVPDAHQLIVPLTLTMDGTELSFFTTIASLASPADITLQELRLETLLPANPATAAALHQAAAAG